MKFAIAIIFFKIILFQDASALIKCNALEIHISGHLVNAYTTKVGKKVSGYYKDEYCRKSKLRTENLKFETKAPDGWVFDEIFKVWSEKDLNQFFNDGDRLPLLLRKQIIERVFRGGKSIYPNNPAAALPSSKFLILYDDYFKRKDRVRVLGHEMAHLLYWQLKREQKIEFAQISGWDFDEVKGVRTPPKKVIYEDSADSPSEDFANNIEAYYFDRNYLKKNNSKLLKYVEILEREMK